MNQYDADAQSMGFRSSEDLAEYQRWAAAKPTQPEETIDDVKQAYALLFKAHGELRAERNALLDKVRDYGGRMTDEQSSTLAELDEAIAANDLPSVGTEDARAMAYAQEEGDRSGCWYPGKAAGEMLRTLVSERDELASRARELEANARRYEWLRENNAYSIHDRLFADCPMHKFNDAMLDAAIDANKGGAA